MERSGFRPNGGGEQLPLLPAALAEATAAEAAGEVARRGPGRPPGARNRRTDEWVDYLLGRYRSPLVVLAETYSRPVEVLAAELGCTREDAFKIQIEAASRLAPYLHQKQPLAVNVNAQGVVQLVIETAAMRGQISGADGEFTIEAEIVENQGVGDDDRA
jgi:hypothetical protein